MSKERHELLYFLKEMLRPIIDPVFPEYKHTVLHETSRYTNICTGIVQAR